MLQAVEALQWVVLLLQAGKALQWEELLLQAGEALQWERELLLLQAEELQEEEEEEEELGVVAELGAGKLRQGHMGKGLEEQEKDESWGCGPKLHNQGP